jgi:hypothetical protein
VEGVIQENDPDEQQKRIRYLGLLAASLIYWNERDHVGQFMAHLEEQAAFAKAEVKRLQAREEFYEKVFARMEGYVMRVIDSLGLDDKGKRKKLEGNTITFSLRGCDKRAEVTDEVAVPTKYKRVTVTGRDVGAGVRFSGPRSPRSGARGGEVGQGRSLYQSGQDGLEGGYRGPRRRAGRGHVSGAEIKARQVASDPLPGGASESRI